MATVLDLKFTSNIEGFDIGTRNSGEGEDFSNGFLQIPAGTGSNVISTRSFSSISSGVFRLDFWYRMTDSVSIGNDTSSTFIYLLPTLGSIASSNSIITIILSRNSSSHGATSSQAGLCYRDGSGVAFVPFDNISPIYKGAWHKISIVANFSTHKCDIYFNDILWTRNLDWANSSAADFGRLVLLNGAASPVVDFDSFLLTSDWTLPTESVIIDDDFTSGSGQIEASNPSTDERNIHPQPWLIPTASGFGGFTRTANGLVPNENANCFALVRGLPEGIVEGTFKTSVSGVINFGIIARAWSGNSADRFYFRYSSVASAGQKLAIIQDSYYIGASDGTGVVFSGNTTYTLKLEMRGRYMWAYVKEGSGAYQLQFGGPVLIHDIESGARGINSEENMGPSIVTTVGATDNYVLRFTLTGRKRSQHVNATVGNYTVNSDPGSIRELYVTDSQKPTRNLFWSKGIQHGHRATADTFNYTGAHSVIYSSSNLVMIRQRSLNLNELQMISTAECYITLLRRGPVLDDAMFVYITGLSCSPDHDFRPDMTQGSYRIAGATGSSTLLNDSPSHLFRDDMTGAALPLSLQRVSTFGTGNEIRFTATLTNIANYTAANNQFSHKISNDGDPISHLFPHNYNLTAQTNYEAGRYYLIESGPGLSLSDTAITDFRDDIKTPATLTFSLGSLKTNATGDYNTNGFNERYGWHEINCSEGKATFTLPVTSGKRHGPTFRLHSHTLSTNPTIYINSNLVYSDIDYVWDDIGDGTGVLQLLSNRTASTTIEITQHVSSAQPSILMMLAS